MTSAELSVIFFLQMFFILAVCRLVGLVARRLGQPQVVGEMIAGVLIGPSLLGNLFPELHGKLFPADSLNILYVAAQFGIGLYMFLVGAEFKTELFRSRFRSAASVSLAGILAPFALGALLAPWLMTKPGLFSAQVKLHEAILFLGAAISITAFPMLARIIYERGLSGSSLGTLALAAGAIGDAVAWGVFSIVLASFGGGATVAVKAIGGGIVFTALVLTFGRRMLQPLEAVVARQGELTPALLAVVLMLYSLAALVTDFIGIHAVFGGFILGVAMPRGLLTESVRRQIEPFTVVFLLPMFFTYSGLNTRLDLVNSGEMLLIAGVVLAASCLGKFGACWAAARLSGEDQPTALALGALMNSRGLMELIILNIGLQKGVIQSGLFSVLVLMAIVTTLMTSPLFEWVYGRKARREGTLRSATG